MTTFSNLQNGEFAHELLKSLASRNQMNHDTIVNNSVNQTSPRTPLHGRLSTFDRREARAKEHEARPPPRFISLLRPLPVNQKPKPSGNTLLAQRYPISGNSYFWRTGWRRSDLSHTT